MADVVDELRAIVGADQVLTDRDVRRGYEVDWTGRYSGDSIAVVRPGTTTEVAAVLARCTELGIAVVPQGGNTGLVGGGVPRGDDRSTIVLSTQRFSEVGPVDVDEMQVTAGAGVTLAAWRARARDAGCDAPVDFAARDSATVGGAIATNAGGSRVLRYGTMRHQVTGIEAVLATGGVVGSMAGLPKETAGVHWPSLLAGSEGTLAVVTRARLRVVPLFAHTVTALVAMRSVDDAVALLGTLRRDIASLDAAEIVLPTAMDIVVAHVEAACPVAAPPAGCYVLIDCAAASDPTDELTSALQRHETRVIDAAMATDSAQRAKLLDFRDRVTEAIAATATRLGTPTFKLDVAVPISALGALIDAAQRAAARNGATLVAFGHLAEGNLHLNHLGAADPDAIAAEVLPFVAELGGTISAEHGIGIAKNHWLHLIRAPADLAAQTALRDALDPAHTLNPGVLDARGKPAGGSGDGVDDGAGGDRGGDQEPEGKPRSGAVNRGR